MSLTKLMAGFLIPVLFLIAPAAQAAHPLITDDAFTQGTGRFQLELNGQYDWDKETVDGVARKFTGGVATATLSYGIFNNTDLVMSLPYVWGKIEAEDGSVSYNEKGVSDSFFEVKWRFFEKEGLKLAVKPGIRFPSGNHDRGLGSGRLGGHVFLIGSKELEPWAFHANLGYARNENKLDERKDIWHASFAVTREVVKNLLLVGNIGQERNPDPNGKNDPAFFILGLIYSVTENFDVDCGVKFGLNSSEADKSVLAGITLRF